MHSHFVPLHLHTHYSLLDGAIRINDLIEKAREYRLPAVAITDHGNLFGAIDFYKRVSSAGLKPIIGCEVYITSRDHTKSNRPNVNGDQTFHLILLCKDINGYRNLSRLVSKAFIDGFYYKPRIDKDLLAQYSGGLIGLSACLKGEIPQLLSSGMVDKARETALGYQRILGTDNFYLEVQANELPEQEEINKQLLELGRDLHIEVVATNDSHYLTRDDAKAHDVLLCIQTGKTLKDEDRMRFSRDSFYLKSPEAMMETFIDYPEVIENTRKIAEKCNLDLDFGKFHLPKYPVKKSGDENRYLTKLAIDGLKMRLNGRIPDDYEERLNSELTTIKSMGFSSYFLIVWDFIRYAKSREIPVGPGRGSAAGSLVAYSLEITDIDPMKYGLLFERFLNPERVSMPDIDIDFCMDRRAEVIEHVMDQYGRDRVAQIITFGTMKARGAIRDVGRAMNIPYSEVDKVAKLVPLDPKITLKKAVEIEPSLKEIYEESSEMRDLINIAQRLEGLSRHASTHAAGIVISPEPLTDFLPLYKAANDEAIITQYDMDSIKRLGLLKFDFLGLKTLTVIDKAEKMINSFFTGQGKNNESPFSVEQIPLDDPETFRLLGEARTTGIFQLESQGMRDILTRLKPDVFVDLIALVALYRPGPIGSGMVDDFIASKTGRVTGNGYKRPGSISKLSLRRLDDILKETHGIILYQEQVMEIAHKLADFSLAQADILRKAMGGKNPEEMEKLKSEFIEGVKENRIPEHKAETLFNMILQFAQYGFNKSHSAAYALIAYRTAYLKAHYPVAFMAASLSSDMDNTDKVVGFINECREMGIEILPPHINESGREFTVNGNSIRFGLEAVKGVGSSAIESIIRVREKRKFDSFIDLCSRVDSRKVGKKVLESLIKAGALDFMGSRSQLMCILNSTMDAALKVQRERAIGQSSMFGMDDTEMLPLPDVEEWKESKRLMMEKEALGFYITGHPLNRYREKLNELSVIPTSALKDCDDKQSVTVGGIIRDFRKKQTKRGDFMAYLTVEDMHGTVEMIAFPDIYREVVDLLSMDSPVILHGSVDRTDKGLKVVIRSMEPIDTARKADISLPKAESGGCPAKASLVLTLFQNTDIRKLSELNDIFVKYSGKSCVYFKIIAPDLWETLLKTDRHIKPSREMLKEVEDLLGQGTATLN
jgi:DNA polymerase-3 subunit alpha